ncbi:MAG: hypothetical protein NZ849_10730, partial [Meiothermus sp.]|nr:hypothetical protein [Meiothermus sp.]
WMFRLDGLKVAVHGGWGEIGGNQIVLEAPEGSVLLDFGRSFSRWNRHFTEFLTPAAAWGCATCWPDSICPGRLQAW